MWYDLLSQIFEILIIVFTGGALIFERIELSSKEKKKKSTVSILKYTFAIFAFISSICIWYFNNELDQIKNRENEVYRIDAELKHNKLKNETFELKSKNSELSIEFELEKQKNKIQILELENRNAKVKIELEKEKINRTKLENSLSPRLLYDISFDELINYNSCKLEIYTFRDSESLRLANQLAHLLLVSGWEVKLDFHDNYLEGLHIFYSQTSDEDAAKNEISYGAVSVLVDNLESNMITPSFVGVDKSISFNTIVIIIGFQEYDHFKEKAKTLLASKYDSLGNNGLDKEISEVIDALEIFYSLFNQLEVKMETDFKVKEYELFNKYGEEIYYYNKSIGSNLYKEARNSWWYDRKIFSIELNRNFKFTLYEKCHVLLELSYEKYPELKNRYSRDLKKYTFRILNEGLPIQSISDIKSMIEIFSDVKDLLQTKE